MRLQQARWKPRKSKEGYQTLDRERQASYATQPEVALRLMEQNGKRAMCDTDLLSPPRLSQRTWLHYFMSLAGNQQCCLIPSKTTLWIINARSQNKKGTLLMYSEHPLKGAAAGATVPPSHSVSEQVALRVFMCRTSYKGGYVLNKNNNEILWITNGNWWDRNLKIISQRFHLTFVGQSEKLRLHILFISHLTWHYCHHKIIWHEA